MKLSRFVTVFLSLAILFSVLGSSVAYAKPAANVLEKAKITQVTIKITNKTGGIIYISMTTPGHSYFFNAPVGKSTYIIAPGKYSFTLTSPTCGGSVTRTRAFTGRTGNLGTWVCRR